jgi:hypothetical protein
VRGVFGGGGGLKCSFQFSVTLAVAAGFSPIPFNKAKR